MRHSAQQTGGGGGGRYAKGVGDEGRYGRERLSRRRIVILLVLLEQLATGSPETFDKTLHALTFPGRRRVRIDLGVRVIGIGC